MSAQGTYDFVVIGAGSAGCPIVAGLADAFIITSMASGNTNAPMTIGHRAGQIIAKDAA